MRVTLKEPLGHAELSVDRPPTGADVYVFILKLGTYSDCLITQPFMKKKLRADGAVVAVAAQRT